uniref:Uncharacterized protein n=1 Tax=Myoviridae sp. ctwVB15 TaxID=2825208 RepID=A0A8S5UNC9_9CAUD|nr:MAG TPA: hypothetical protein [Myoviridae sp. ctwVB15]
MSNRSVISIDGNNSENSPTAQTMPVGLFSLKSVICTSKKECCSRRSGGSFPACLFHNRDRSADTDRKSHRLKRSCNPRKTSGSPRVSRTRRASSNAFCFFLNDSFSYFRFPKL